MYFVTSVKVCTMIEVSSEQSRTWEVSFICIHSGAAAAAAAVLCCYYCSFSLCYVGTVCGFTIEYIDLTNHKYTVRCCTTYEYAFIYTCHVFLLLLCTVLLYCCCCSCCCLLLLFVIVYRMAKFVAVVHCIWFQCFLSLHSNTIYFQCIPWQYCRIYSVDFVTYA